MMTFKLGRTLKYILGSSFLLGNVALFKSNHKANRVVSHKQNKNYQDAIAKSRKILFDKKMECKCPGLSVVVSVDGEVVWQEGIGYSDLENNIEMNSSTNIRIASISKSFTSFLLMYLSQIGKLDLDEDIRTYVPSWPIKHYNDQQVQISTRHLATMMGGIRDYTKCPHEPKDKKKKKNKDSDLAEVYMNRPYSTIDQSLNIFKNDHLCSSPGSNFLYTTHGWTLVAGVIEGAAGHKFEELMGAMLRDMNLPECHLDRNRNLISRRSRYYEVDKEGKIRNAPEVDLSYKWAGGGLTCDLKSVVAFGNLMMSCHQGGPRCQLRGGELRGMLDGDNVVLKREKVEEYWQGATRKFKDGSRYGMGWYIDDEAVPDHKVVFHTGGAVGASSVLMMLMRRQRHETGRLEGVVVALACNLTDVSLRKEALKISKIFHHVS